MSPRPLFPLFRWRARHGFTLVEMLVSMTVLTLLLVMVTQMIGATAAVTSDGAHHLDADSQARLVLDRMTVDFAQIVKRPDVDYYLQKNGSGGTGADDQMAFYSETSGYYPAGLTNTVPKSNTSLVGYRVYQRQLQRLDKALVWSGVDSTTDGAHGLMTTPRGMTFLPQTLITVWPNVAGSNNDPDYHTIAEQIFRMEVCFLLRSTATAPAKFSDVPCLDTSTTPLVYNGLRDVAAVVVTLAVLDDTSRLIVNTTDLDTAAGKLEDSSATPPAQRWLAHVNDGSLGRAKGGSLPTTAAARVRVYERYFYLGNTQ